MQPNISKLFVIDYRHQSLSRLVLLHIVCVVIFPPFTRREALFCLSYYSCMCLPSNKIVWDALLEMYGIFSYTSAYTIITRSSIIMQQRITPKHSMCSWLSAKYSLSASEQVVFVKQWKQTKFTTFLWVVKQTIGDNCCDWVLIKGNKLWMILVEIVAKNTIWCMWVFSMLIFIKNSI